VSAAPASRPPRPRSVLAFGGLLYAGWLILANLASFGGAGPEPLPVWFELPGQLTGNAQGWELFTRGRMPLAVFPAANRELAQDSADLKEPTEPTEVVYASCFWRPTRSGYRWPLVQHRRFNYEMNLTLEAEFYPEDPSGADPGWDTLLEETAARRAAAWQRWLVLEIGQPQGEVFILRQSSTKNLKTWPWVRIRRSSARESPSARESELETFEVQWWNPRTSRWQSLPRDVIPNRYAGAPPR